MSHLYYKTLRTSETGKKMQALIDKGKMIENNIIDFLKEIEAKDKYLHNGVFNTGLVGVQFEAIPDLKFWRQENSKDYPGFYCPRLKSKKGKVLAERFYSFGKINRNDINEVIGFGQIFQHCGFFKDKEGEYFGFITESDWNHQMPQDCEEIKGSEYEQMCRS